MKTLLFWVLRVVLINNCIDVEFVSLYSTKAMRRSSYMVVRIKDFKSLSVQLACSSTCDRY